MNRVWKPNVTVAAVVERCGRFLLVEEQTEEGLQLNQPAGHLEPGESLVDAVIRETLEETAHHFIPDSVVGVYQWLRPQGDITYLRFAFGGKVGEAVNGIVLDTGIERSLWMSLEELRACRDRHRSPLVLKCAEDWVAGHRFGLEMLCHVA
ncbi:MAG TPA: NUDIX hydrolase [Rhodocyclaceae bacterium]|jgi:8-oxo-dGTP pyrophosphatase MutT (NUDIX family)|nr:NUDIX hydrolase [Rhodocyclaceae bacterium]HRQ46602.1 NUDIX hydrolase [Rhodocyclaceae bacterium]